LSYTRKFVRWRYVTRRNYSAVRHPYLWVMQ